MKKYRELVRDLSVDSFKNITLYTFVSGILAHGYILFNKLSWHDDLSHGFRLSINQAVSLGRWMRAFLGFVVMKLTGENNFSLPVLNGMASIFIIAASAWLITLIFDIKEKIWQVTLCGLMVTFPVVTSTFAYMFTAPYYMLALFLAIAAVYVSAKRRGWLSFLASSLCVCMSLGIYQAYFEVTTSLYVIMLVFDVARHRYSNARQLFLRGIYCLGICVVGMLGYFVIWKATQRFLGIATNDYQGLSSMGTNELRAYLDATRQAYRCFFMTGVKANQDMFPFGLRRIQWCAIGLSILCALRMIAQQIKSDKLMGIMQALLIILLPVCFNLVYVMGAMTPDSSIHSLMLYGQAMLYVFLICVVKWIHESRIRFATVLKNVVVVLLILMVCINTYFDNSCYFKAQYVQQETISNLTVLVSRIKALEGYNDTLPVCFIRKGKIDATLTSIPGLTNIKNTPYTIIFPHSAERNLVNYLKYWCGFEPKTVSPNAFKNLEEVKQMPDYPDDGSVKIINDTVVVKW